MRKVSDDYILLNPVEIKKRIEDAVSFDHSKYEQKEILFENKLNNFPKLPYSGLKLSISEERKIEKAYIDNIRKMMTYKYQKRKYQEQLDEYNKRVDELQKHKMLETSKEEEKKENPFKQIINKTEKKQKSKPKKSKVIKVDTMAVIAKIKKEAREKNKGKKTISRREINKMLDPEGKKKKFMDDLGSFPNDKEILTSIDIYLNAVNKINTSKEKDAVKDDVNKLSNKKELNISDVLKDLNS